MSDHETGSEVPGFSIRPLREKDLDGADRVFRLAFGTFISLPDPAAFAGDSDYIRTRFRAEPGAAFAAERAGKVVGSNFARCWGTVGTFGPLSVHPEWWGRGIGSGLMGPVLELFDRWNVQLAGLYTFSHSALHLSLYQKFGFWPRFLTSLMVRNIRFSPRMRGGRRFSRLTVEDQVTAVNDCREVTDAIYPGLDVEREIRATCSQGLGETGLLDDDSRLVGFAVCHCGAGSEAGSDLCYMKFAAVRPGPQAAHHFERLLEACDGIAIRTGQRRLVAGISTGRTEAYRQMLAQGFQPRQIGVTMHRPNEPGYDRPEVRVLDDWR